MGVKKSTVCTSASSGEILYTPASSALSKPTSTFASCCRANFPSTASSAAGLSLLAQPAAFTDSVRRSGVVVSAMQRLYVGSRIKIHHRDTETQRTQSDTLCLSVRRDAEVYPSPGSI